MASHDYQDQSVRKPSLFEPYKMHKHIGKCLIINNEHFSGSPRMRRVGCLVDEQLVSSTFKSLGFTVQVEKNLSVNQMLATLRKVSRDDHTNMSCFVCVIMSHGEEGMIVGSDLGMISVKTLTSTMTSDLCPSLEGKPKLFFLQACRGEEYDAGVETDSAEESEEFIGMSDVPEANFLCCYSTVEGYYSWRNPETGSVFIRVLCEMLKQYRHMEIIQILTRTNHNVAHQFQSRTYNQKTDRKRQMPCVSSRLTKEFYLHISEKKKKW